MTSSTPSSVSVSFSSAPSSPHYAPPSPARLHLSSSSSSSSLQMTAATTPPLVASAKSGNGGPVGHTSFRSAPPLAHSSRHPTAAVDGREGRGGGGDTDFPSPAIRIPSPTKRWQPPYALRASSIAPAAGVSPSFSPALRLSGTIIRNDPHSESTPGGADTMDAVVQRYRQVRAQWELWQSQGTQRTGMATPRAQRQSGTSTTTTASRSALSEKTKEGGADGSPSTALQPKQSARSGGWRRWGPAVVVVPSLWQSIVQRWLPSEEDAHHSGQPVPPPSPQKSDRTRIELSSGSHSGTEESTEEAQRLNRPPPLPAGRKNHRPDGVLRRSQRRLKERLQRYRRSSRNAYAVSGGEEGSATTRSPADDAFSLSWIRGMSRSSDNLGAACNVDEESDVFFPHADPDSPSNEVQWSQSPVLQLHRVPSPPRSRVRRIFDRLHPGLRRRGRRASRRHATATQSVKGKPTLHSGASASSSAAHWHAFIRRVTSPSSALLTAWERPLPGIRPVQPSQEIAAAAAAPWQAGVSSGPLSSSSSSSSYSAASHDDLSVPSEESPTGSEEEKHETGKEDQQSARESEGERLATNAAGTGSVVLQTSRSEGRASTVTALHFPSSSSSSSSFSSFAAVTSLSHPPSGRSSDGGAGARAVSKPAPREVLTLPLRTKRDFGVPHARTHAAPCCGGGGGGRVPAGDVGEPKRRVAVVVEGSRLQWEEEEEQAAARLARSLQRVSQLVAPHSTPLHPSTHTMVHQTEDTTTFRDKTVMEAKGNEEVPLFAQNPSPTLSSLSAKLRKAEEEEEEEEANVSSPSHAVSIFSPVQRWPAPPQPPATTTATAATKSARGAASRASREAQWGLALEKEEAAVQRSLLTSTTHTTHDDAARAVYDATVHQVCTRLVHNAVTQVLGEANGAADRALSECVLHDLVQQIVAANGHAEKQQDNHHEGTVAATFTGVLRHIRDQRPVSLSALSLDAEDQDVLRVIARNANSPATAVRCVSDGGYNVSYSQLATLRPRTWVNDQVINSYLHLLCTEVNASAGCEVVASLGTHFYAKVSAELERLGSEPRRQQRPVVWLVTRDNEEEEGDDKKNSGADDARKRYGAAGVRGAMDWMRYDGFAELPANSAMLRWLRRRAHLLLPYALPTTAEAVTALTSPRGGGGGGEGGAPATGTTTVRQVLIPVNLHDQHWALVVLDKARHGTWTYYDSLSSGGGMERGTDVGKGHRIIAELDHVWRECARHLSPPSWLPSAPPAAARQPPAVPPSSVSSSASPASLRAAHESMPAVPTRVVIAASYAPLNSSMTGSGCAPKEVRRAIDAVSASLHAEHHTITDRSHCLVDTVGVEWGAPGQGKMPQQRNGDDCGVFVCTSAWCVAQGVEVSFTHGEVQHLREVISLELWAQRLLRRLPTPHMSSSADVALDTL